MSGIVTPSGIMHMDVAVYDYFYGDIEGPVTFFEQFNVIGHGSLVLTSSGPFEATVTWNGRTGMIWGQWTTNCSMVTGCDGTMNARGSGELEDVQFHFKWGPGDYPFPYTATVLYR